MPKKDTPPAPDGDSIAGTHYKVLARRWRPQTFDDLVGQEAIAQALAGAIQAGRVAHAYLFTGARGVGKTSTARILAKALNCQTGPTVKPCGQCDACESIASGDDVDVLEIDGASNRGIDEVRELRQNANLRPTRSRYKIYIIDEVHMLTREAFNALLKTLEEPPAHVKFIFATTDPQKIPVTILSRCQRFDFGTIANDRIRKRLEEIVASEGIAVDDDVLELLTRRAAGSMRDSLSLLDQLLAFGGERVTADQVHRLLGTTSEDRLADLITALLGRNPGAAIEIVDQAETQGVQLGELIDQLIEYFRDLMIVKSAGPKARLVSVSNRQRERIVEQSASVELEFVFAATDILSETRARLRGTNYGRVLLDVALVRIAELENLAALGDLVEQLRSAESRGGGQPALPAARPAPAAARPEPESKKKSHDGESKGDSAPPVSGVSPLPEPEPPTAPVPAAPQIVVELTESPSEPRATELQSVSSLTPPGGVPRPLTNEAAAQILRDIANGFGPVMRESILRAQVSVVADTLVVHLNAVYNEKELESTLQQRAGSGLRIRVERSTATSADSTAGSSYTERLSEANRDPLVQQATEVMGARIMRVEET